MEQALADGAFGLVAVTRALIANRPAAASRAGADGRAASGYPRASPPVGPGAAGGPTGASSEGDDDGDKRTDFQSLASLQAYVFVAQDQRRVKVYRRVGSEWQLMTYGDGDNFELSRLSAPIAVAEIYDGILDAAGTSLLRA